MAESVEDFGVVGLEDDMITEPERLRRVANWGDQEKVNKNFATSIGARMSHGDKKMSAFASHDLWSDKPTDLTQGGDPNLN